MPIDYASISAKHDYEAMLVNVTRKIIVPLYEDPTHFIFELLQNAEDALSKRDGLGSRTVSFELSSSGLKVSHFGKPFDESNVRAICSVGDSSKQEEVTAIGKFGIGFKSVYCLTDRPEVHSGEEHFAIENFVHPVEVKPLLLEVGETVFWFPFKPGIGDTVTKIRSALENLPASTLLFLQHIKEIRWSIEDGESGSCSRTPKKLGESIHRCTLKRARDGKKLPSESWLICSRPVFHRGNRVGAAELAFQLDNGSSEPIVRPLANSKLVAYFPTTVDTKLGFLIQAPFQTTPSRETVPADKEWNQYLATELAKLLVDSLVSLRQLGALSLELLSALPLSRNDFPNGSLLAPLYDATLEAIREQPLLPTADGKWVSSENAIIARGDGLRKLLRHQQLAAMFGTSKSAKWLSENLTVTRYALLYRYLTGIQRVEEVTPEKCLPRWSQSFLEAQSDSWLIELYTFWLKQPALMSESAFQGRPWVRMEDGSHRTAYSAGQPNAFLPIEDREIGFPTVRRTLMKSKAAVEFFQKLNLSTPDPVDDVIAHVLPKYGRARVDIALEDYSADFRRVVEASVTDSKNQLEKLSAACRTKKIVLAVDGCGSRSWVTPELVYISTDNLKTLFEGLTTVRMVDSSLPCLRGDQVRSLLRSSGAARYLRAVHADLSESERNKLRNGSRCTGDESVDDRDLRGLAELLKHIPKLPDEEARLRCKALWDALVDFVQEAGETGLQAVYRWKYYERRARCFPAKFVRRLQAAKWIPNEEGKLVKPSDAVFERIPGGWKENAALQKALEFKPPVLEILAKEMGVEPEMLNLLLKRGIKTKAQLQEFLTEEPAANEQADDDAQETSTHDGASDESGAASRSGASESSSRIGAGSGAGSRSQTGGTASGGSSSTSGSLASSPNKNSHAGRTEFFSYLKTHPVEVEEDEFSDSETHEQRMRVEAVAIDHILTLESDLQRTPAGNKGYDLFGTDVEGHTNRWIEVKAMVGTLANHPVGMSKAQFEMAMEKRYRYWLYIVENATSEEPRILKIQDPAGNARTFTFDEGWREIAMVSQVNVETGEVIR